MREIDENCYNVPIGLVKIYWVGGGYSLASISNNGSDNKYFHCCDWISVECPSLKEALKDIIRIELIEQA